MSEPLNNPAVDANSLETSVMKLWQEFLARYFDGGQHDVGAVGLLRLRGQSRRQSQRE